MRTLTLSLAALILVGFASAARADHLVLSYPDRVHSADRSDYQFWFINTGGLRPSLTLKLRAGFYGVTVDCKTPWDDEGMTELSIAFTKKIAEAKVIDLLPELAALGLGDCAVDY